MHKIGISNRTFTHKIRLPIFDFLHKIGLISFRKKFISFAYLAVFFSLPFFALPFFGNTKLLLNIKIVFMKGYTYDKSLSEIEEQILSLVYSGNEHYLNAFNFVHKFYRINYRLHKSNHLAVFLDELNLSPRNDFTIGEMTAYVEMLEILQRRKKATRHGLDFVIDDKYKL